MRPNLREVLEQADTLVEAVIEVLQLDLDDGLEPGERKRTVNDMCDLQQVRTALFKVIHT